MRNLLLNLSTQQTSAFDSVTVAYYFGTDNLMLFWSCLLFGCLGVVVMVMIDVTGRDVSSKSSPPEFSWSYFWADNLLRFILNLILVFVAIRFMQQFTNKPATQFYSFFLGLGSDKLVAMVKKKKDSFFSEIDGGGNKTDVAVSVVNAAPAPIVAPEVVAPAPVATVDATQVTQQENNQEVQ